MADVKWIKIVTDIFDDEKILLIESLPEADAIIVIWFKLLCLAGKQNNQGVFLLNNRIAYTDEMLATIFRRNISTVRLAINTFENFGMIEIIDGVITIPNWSKHQSLDQLENKREYMRNYMAKRRLEQKTLCEESCKTNSKTNSETNVSCADKNKSKNRKENNNMSIFDSDFEELWKMYPKKDGKTNAKKAFVKAMKAGVAKETIADGIRRYIAYIQATGQYVKNGSTWFNQECWNDEYKLEGRFKDERGSTDPRKQYWNDDDPTVF